MIGAQEYKFFKLCEEKQYFKAGSNVLIALSAGQDSMTLFNWLYDLREKLSIHLVVAHVNHKQRAESEAEEEFVKQTMAKLKIPCFTAAFQGNFDEKSAREFRYSFFEKVMRENEVKTLVTAHHHGDQAETVYMRLLTGRRLRHLTGIAERQPFASGELIRPLLSFKKSELDAEFFFEDQSNQENEYLRNRVRNLYLPDLEKENPKIQYALVDLAEEIARSQRLLTRQIEELSILDERIDLKKFLATDEDMQYFILQAYLEKFKDFQVNKGQFENMLQIIRRPQQYDGKIKKDYFFIKNAKEFYLTKGQSSIEIEILTENPNNQDFLPVCLEQDADYQLRKRQEGDQIKINGKKKSLKKFFIDEKVALERREQAVIAVGKEIYAIPILGITSDLSVALENATIKKRIWLNVKKGQRNA